MAVATIPVLEDNYIFIISAGTEAVVVDPAQAAPVIDFLEQNQLNLVAILNTHHHWDHVGGNRELVAKYSCEVWGYRHDAERIPEISVLVDERQVLQVLGKSVTVFAVPGHTLGHIAYWFADEALLFCGDTLFSLGCGRLFEGSPQQMWNSLQQLRDLPDDTQVFCAHEYTLANGRFASKVDPNNEDLRDYLSHCQSLRAREQPTIPTTLKIEKACNPFLRADDPQLQQNLGQGSDAVSLFGWLRSQKDQF